MHDDNHQLQWNDCIFKQRTYHAATSGTHVQFIGISYVSEMQRWFVTVFSNEFDQCALWDTTSRLDAVHDTNGLASYLIKSYDDTDGTLISSEDLRLRLSTLIVWYKCCGKVVVFLAFRCVALALALRVVALALGVWPCYHHCTHMATYVWKISTRGIRWCLDSTEIRFQPGHRPRPRWRGHDTSTDPRVG